MTRIIPWNIWHKMSQADKDNELETMCRHLYGSGVRIVQYETFLSYLYRKLFP